MLASALVAEVERLLAEETLSQRAIARLTGISRGTVGAIAAGRRPDYEVLRKAVPDEEPLGPLQRCPRCGGMVYAPCRLCRVRAAIKRTHATLHSDSAARRLDTDFSLALRPEHQARYEQVREHRRATDDASPPDGSGDDRDPTTDAWEEPFLVAVA